MDGNSPMEELAKRLSALEKEAFKEFGRIFGPRFVCLFIGKFGLTRWEAKNLATSCITDISLKVREHYRPRSDSRFDAWVGTLAQRAAIDWLRRQKKRRQIVEETLERIRRGDDVEIEPNQDVIQAVQEAVRRLSEKDQEILRLRHFEGIATFREISETLGIKHGAARVRYSRAITRLKDKLKNDQRIHKLLMNKNRENHNNNE